jgi:hypothetical protein
MQFHVVRSAEPGCEPQCPEWIAAQGKIEAGASVRFAKLLSQLGDRRLPMLIDSSGGRVTEAFEIGRLARARGLDVVVGRTLLAPCETPDPTCRRARADTVRLGLPQADMAKCASACAFVLAAGVRRSVAPTAFVGVHQIRSFYIYARVMRTYRYTATRKQLVSERRVTDRVVETHTPQKTYDDIRRYFTEMGIGEAIMPMILQTPGDRLHWLTRNELKVTGLATEFDGALLPLAGAATGPVIGPGAGPVTAIGTGPATGTQAVPPITSIKASVTVPPR